MGRREALIAVVLARSYSRNSGRMSLLRLTVSPSRVSRSRSQRACEGLIKLKSRQTATCLARDSIS